MYSTCGPWGVTAGAAFVAEFSDSCFFGWLSGRMPHQSTLPIVFNEKTRQPSGVQQNLSITDVIFVRFSHSRVAPTQRSNARVDCEATILPPLRVRLTSEKELSPAVISVNCRLGYETRQS